MFATIKSLIPEPRQADQPRRYIGRHRQPEPLSVVPPLDGRTPGLDDSLPANDDSLPDSEATGTSRTDDAAEPVTADIAP